MKLGVALMGGRSHSAAFCHLLWSAFRSPALLVLLIFHFVVPSMAGSDSVNRIDDVTIFNPNLGREIRFAVVRPADGDRDRPVLYLLHGRGRSPHSLLELPDTRAALLEANLWIVLPDGEDGWYINSPISAADRFSDLLEAIIHEASTRYLLRTDPGGQAIAGWSMGGYGAVRFAQLTPGRFGTVASMIGLLDFPREETLPRGQNYTVPVARFGDDSALWQAFNPLHAAVAFRGTAVLLVTAEDSFDRTMNENFSRELNRTGVPHMLRVLPGGHTLDVVRAALPEVLAFVHRSSRPISRP